MNPRDASIVCQSLLKPILETHAWDRLAKPEQEAGRLRLKLQAALTVYASGVKALTVEKTNVQG